jgi:uncharacterized protein
LLSDKKLAMNRRHFLGYSGAVAAGIAASASSASAKPFNPMASKKGYPELFQESFKYRKWDSHSHISLGKSTPEKIIESMDRVGIEKAGVSVPLGKEPDEIRQSNDQVIKAMKQFPDRIMGQCYINPAFQRQAIDEIKRCLDAGMVQLGELYTLYKINDPVYYPIIEFCIQCRLPLLMHARCDLGLWRKGYPCDAPLSTSMTDDFVEIGNRYPEAKIIHAHIGGGGDWEYMCKRLRSAPSICLDTSGSVTDEGMIDFAITCLGEDRLLFASDLNFETAIGKIMAAHLNEQQRKKIFFDNYYNLLKRI